MLVLVQVLLNLLLTGTASSHLFNDKLEDYEDGRLVAILKGITSRCDIGFLSLNERLKKNQVEQLMFNLLQHRHNYIYLMYNYCSGIDWDVLENSPPPDLGGAYQKQSLRVFRSKSRFNEQLAC